MKDKIDNSDSGFDIVFLGHYTKENSFKYNDTEYNVKTCHEGIRGISMSAHINGQVPEFTDGEGHWSLAAWLSKYRTMDDAGNRLPWSAAGATVTGQDGNQYTIGTSVTSEQMLNNINVCVPTHVLIMLSMNGGATIAQYNTMISAIKTTAPNCIIGIAIPDCEGTYFPSKHPTYGEEAAYWINKQGWGAEAQHNQQRNVQQKVTNEYANAESENNGIYVLPFFFVTPPAESISNRLIPLPDSDVNKASKLNFDAYGWGPQVHTNAYGHMHWGYQLYSWIKYTIAKAL